RAPRPPFTHRTEIASVARARRGQGFTFRRTGEPRWNARSARPSLADGRSTAPGPLDPRGASVELCALLTGAPMFRRASLVLCATSLVLAGCECQPHPADPDASSDGGTDRDGQVPPG